MNIAGIGSNIPKISRADNAVSPNRTNGKDAELLESKDNFKRVFQGKKDIQDKKPAEEKELASPLESNTQFQTYSKSPPTEPRELGKAIEGSNEELVEVPVDVEVEGSSDTVDYPLMNKKDSTVEQMDQAEKVQPQVNAETSAMVTFLMAMKTELAVEPEKVIQAMTSLDAEAMVKPPEETINQVIQQLDLEPDKKIRAEELYQIMLKDTAEASMSKMLSDNNQSVELEVVGPEQLRMQKLMKSLDELNGKFFDVQRPAKQERQGPPVAIANPYNTLVVPTRDLAPTTVASPALPLFAPTPVGMPTTEAATSSASPAESAPMSIEDILSQLGTQGFNATATPSQNLGAEGDTSSGGKEFLMSKGESENDTSKIDGASEAPSDSLNLVAPQKTDILNVANNPRPGAPLINTSDDAANTRQLVETAQLLAQKGGGSMKIQLRPEGMGFVELRVAVSGGKVDVQMLTENSETKRLLEGGLNELKSGLVQHKLSLENVQIDTNNKTNTQLDNNMTGQDRNTAREFLEQFRDSNLNRRQAGFDFGGGYGARGARKLSPEDVQYSGSKSKSAAKSRRLDMVA